MERVIVGEEIKTTKGELLAVYVTEEVPAGLSPVETISLLRSQGAFISVSHPFDLGRSGHWDVDDLLEITPLIDAIEIFNARCIRAIYNTRAQDFARQHNLLGTAGSDAHCLMEIGKATLFASVSRLCRPQAILTARPITSYIVRALGALFISVCGLAKKYANPPFVTLTAALFHVELSPRGGGGIGRRRGLKIPRWRHLVGSSPTRPTAESYVGTAGSQHIYFQDLTMTDLPYIPEFRHGHHGTS